MKYRNDSVTNQVKWITLMKHLTILLCLGLFLISAPQHVYAHAGSGSHQHPHDPTLEERIEAAEKAAEAAKKEAEAAKKAAEAAKKAAEAAKKEAEAAKKELDRLKKEKERESELDDALGFLDLLKVPIKGVYNTGKFIVNKINEVSKPYYCETCDTWYTGSHICPGPDPFPEPVIIIDESEPPIGGSGSGSK